MPVCGECAHHIAHLVHGPIRSKELHYQIEASELRRIIKRQTDDLRAARGEAKTQPEPAATAKAKRPTMGVVYYVRSGAYIKIGWTSDLNKRMRAYSPDSILLATEQGDRTLETRRHRMFAAHRTHGREWYAMVPALLHHIDAIIAQNGTPDPVTFAAKPVAIPQPRERRPVMPRGWTGHAVVRT